MQPASMRSSSPAAHSRPTWPKPPPVAPPPTTTTTSTTGTTATVTTTTVTTTTITTTTTTTATTTTLPDLRTPIPSRKLTLRDDVTPPISPSARRLAFKSTLTVPAPLGPGDPT